MGKHHVETAMEARAEPWQADKKPDAKRRASQSEYSTSDPRLIETRVKRAFKRGNWPGVAAMPLHLGVTLIDYLNGRTLPEMCLARGRGARILKRTVRLAERCGYDPPAL